MKYFKNYTEFVNESGFHGQPKLTEREYSDEERAKLADKGFALPDGSYPIKDVDDLKNAIQAYGRSKDQAAAAKHIVKRAKALGAEDLVPTSEDFQKSLKEEVSESYKNIPYNVKIAGEYEIMINGKKEFTRVAGFERQNDDSDSLYLMDEDPLKKSLGSFIVKNKDMFKLEKGTTVKAVTTKTSEDIKIKRIGNL